MKKEKGKSAEEFYSLPYYNYGQLVWVDSELLV